VDRAPVITPLRIIACTLAAFVYCTSVLSDDVSRAPSASADNIRAELPKRVLEITDVVLEHHVDPPARQQMILDGIKSLYRKAGVPIPQGLSRRISELATADQTAAFLMGAYPNSAAGSVSAQALEESLIEGLLASVPGQARLISAKDRNVEEQIAGNRYVGVHIALGMDEQEKRPNLVEVMEGGPADRAGGKPGDLIEQIDGVDTKGMALRDAVDRLRGAEGTNVTIKVRQPKSQESRTYTITRGQLPRKTVRGVRKQSSGSWDVRLDGPDPIGYLRITEITASTPHELHTLAHQIESEGARALVLDIRGLNADNLHSTVLLADILLDDGCIGRIATAHGETKYQADSDALFQGWPLVVLIDASTAGTAEWLAAALQDNHRAVLVGAPTSSARGAPGVGVRSTIPVGDGAWSLSLTTGRLERGDGRPLENEVMRSSTMNMSHVAAEQDAEEVLRVARQRFATHAAAAKESTPKAGSPGIARVIPRADSRYGVKPDHTVGGAGNTVARALNHRIAQELSPESDGALKKAVTLLREAIEKK
jgi:carboxyl-terminal processing protease